MGSLKFDPTQGILKSNNKALLYWYKKDILKMKAGPINSLWELPEVTKILRKQRRDGSWKYPAAKENIRTRHNYDFVETHRHLRYLISLYGLDKKHEAIRKAAKFIFSFQSKDGDFRGIYGNQHSPNYTASATELLIKAGYEKDYHIEKVMKWLLDFRLDDGGWAIALRTRGIGSLEPITNFKAKTLLPDKSKPSSHLITGMVLRAFAAHSKYRESAAAKKAGELLKSSFFKSDVHTDRKSKDYWFKFSYPYLWTDLLSSLDVLQKIGFKKGDPNIRKAIDWFVKNQQKTGLWKAGYKTRKEPDTDLWVTLQAMRVLRRYLA